MSQYREIDACLWNDADFTRMSDDGKLVYFWLITDQSIVSLASLRPVLPGIARSMGWDAERFGAAFREAMSAITAHAGRELSR